MTRRELKLSATASSRYVLMMEFIRRYFYDHGGSPSLNEIAIGIGTNRFQVSEMRREAYRRGDLFYTPGKDRSIVLPDRAANLSATEVLLHLRHLGWTVVSMSGTPLSQLPARLTPPHNRPRRRATNDTGGVEQGTGGRDPARDRGGDSTPEGGQAAA